MAANSTVRTTLTILVVVFAVSGLVVGPAAADDHEDGEVTVGDDETGVSVDGNDTSVSATVNGTGITVGQDGVETDDGDVDDEVEGTSVGLPDDTGEQLDDHGDLPYNYSDLTPFYLIPGDRTLCNTPSADPPVDRDDLPDNVSDRIPDNPTPVDPWDPRDPPFNHCDIFDPYSPPFEPTDVPDNPDANAGIPVFDAGEDGVSLLGTAGGQVDDNWPGGDTMYGAQVGPDAVSVMAITDADDGTKDYDQTTAVLVKPGDEEAHIFLSNTVFDRGADFYVDCADGGCTVGESGIGLVGENQVGGGGSNESDSEPLCEEHVSPDDAPDPPEEPPENPTPIDPENPPGPSFGHCAVFNPHDPPIDPENPPDSPDRDHNVHRANASEDGVTFLGDGYVTLDSQEGGPGADVFTGGQGDNDSVTGFTWVAVNDGEKDYVVLTHAKFAPQSATRVGPDGARIVGDGGTTVTVIGRDAGARITCDGEYCTVSNENLLLPDREFQTAQERNQSDDSDDSDSSSSTSSDTSSSTSSPDSSSSESSRSTSGSTTSGGSSTAASGSGGSTVAASGADAGETGVDGQAVRRLDRVPQAFEYGIPDTASVTSTLLSML